ncbi:MAG TPA: helical backbone metal receptor [Burkholderiaceae bacterium]|nr:helical backbone metal receptor [Burkholderiaceae bacterium]
MSAAPRIVSLVPSLTELLFALGLGGHVVGRTGFCVHPRDAVRAVPKVGGTKTVDVDAVIALRPTHLVVNVDENEKPTVERLAEHVPNVIVTHPLVATDNLALYERFGQAFDRAPEAARLSAALSEALAEVEAGQWAPIEVIYLIWKDPWMTVSSDTYIADMLSRVGLRTIGPGGDRRYPEIDWAALPPSRAGLVLFSSEPYMFRERHAREFAREHGLDPGRCLTIDGEMTSWYGPRAIEGLRYLKRLREAVDARAA